MPVMSAPRISRNCHPTTPVGRSYIWNRRAVRVRHRRFQPTYLFISPCICDPFFWWTASPKAPISCISTSVRPAAESFVSLNTCCGGSGYWCRRQQGSPRIVEPVVHQGHPGRKFRLWAYFPLSETDTKVTVGAMTVCTLTSTQSNATFGLWGAVVAPSTDDIHCGRVGLLAQMRRGIALWHADRLGRCFLGTIRHRIIGSLFSSIIHCCLTYISKNRYWFLNYWR